MIKYIILAVILILVLSFFGYDLQAIIEAPVTQHNIEYTKTGVEYVWDNYLSHPIKYFWNNIFLGLLWNSFLHNLGKINSGAPTELEAIGGRIINIGNQGYQPVAE